MNSLNKVVLIGHVGKDPDLKMLSSGAPKASFSLATTQSWKDKTTGERKSVTDWHNIVCFSSSLCTLIQQYIKKGSYLYIEGSLKTREWENDLKNKQYITEIVLNDFSSKLIILNKKDDMGSSTSYYTTEPMTESSYLKEKETLKPMRHEIDDEIPF